MAYTTWQRIKVAIFGHCYLERTGWKGSLPLFIFAVALAYYAALSAREYTWVFQSSDSGDWLMTSNWLVVPQPYGSPLYVLLMRLLGTLPGNTAIWATILLSCLPSAVTVTLIYLAVNKLARNQGIALVSAGVLLGSAVFLTQSTVLEEYALTTMLLALGFWMYLNERRHLTALCWGLAASIHVFVLGAVLFWLIIEWRRYLKPFAAVTVPIVAAFYSYILLLMYLDTPRLLAGGLNMYSLKQYLTVTGGAITGQLSVFEAPKRFLLTGRLLLMSFGLALVPLTTAFKRPLTKPALVCLGVVAWTLWYQTTCLDPLSWTFITFASPFIAVLIGIGLSRLSRTHLKYVTASALVLMAVNAAFLNANTLTNEKPLAMDYYHELRGLPANAVVVAEPGAYSLGLYYTMSEDRPDLIPLVYPYIGHAGDAWGFNDYRDWLNRTYNLGLDDDFDVLTAIAYLKQRGRDVYFASTPTQYSALRRALILEGPEFWQVQRVTGLSGLQPESYIK
jgi:hypothetical protein